MDIKDVLKRIEEELKRLGMSKEEFYAKSGISSATFSHWNTGKFHPSTKKLRSAANVLGVSVEYLLTGEGQKNSPLPDGKGLSDLEYIRSRLPHMSKDDLATLMAELPHIFMEK